MATLPDIDQYEFLVEYVKYQLLPTYKYKDLQVYSSDQMLKDVYFMRPAYQNKQSMGFGLSEEEKSLLYY